MIPDLDISWIVASAVVIVGLLVVIVGAFLVFFESAYRTVSDKKDWTIALLREQIRIAKAHDEARKAAVLVRSDASDLELKALALATGPPRLLETFLYLTDHVSIGFQWDPSTEPIQWKASVRPTPEEIRRNAAILVLWDRYYISSVFPGGFGGYSILASNEAMAVRAIYNRLPEPLKAKVSGEQHRS